MKSVLNTLFSIWSLSLFFLFVPLMLVYYLLVYAFPEKTRLLLVYRMHGVWGMCWRFCSGIRVTISGQEQLRQDTASVMIANHSNMLDIVLMGSCLLHPFKTLIKQEMMRLPLIGWLFAMMGIPVDRSDKESRKASLARMEAALHAGISILIFPEGTRNRTDQPLLPFHDGAFSIAIAAQVPVQPIVISQTRKLQPVHTFRVYPGRAKMQLLPPVPTQGLTEKDTESLKLAIYAMMLAEWEKSH
jgi:1-acyl-sn-glycerol-3-phosphate acyltransferase